MLRKLRFLIPDGMKQKLLYPGFYLSNFKKKVFDSSTNNFKIISAGYKNEFGGYFNIHLSNSLGDVLFHGTDESAFSWPPKEKVAICIKKENEEKGEILAYSEAWNWQQGAFLRWLSDELICYNDFDKGTGNYCLKIINKSGKLKGEIQYPIGAIHQLGKIGVSYNFERLSVLREDYGYFSKEAIDIQAVLNDSTAFRTIDLNNGDIIREIKFDELREILKINPDKDKVNHFEFSPNGRKVAYLYRYWLGNIKFTKLMVFDLENGSNSLIGEEDFYSHFCWLDNQKIIVFGQLGKENKFFVIDIALNRKVIPDYFVPFHDSHPTTNLDNILVFDSYPSFFRRSTVYLLNLEKSKNSIIYEAVHHPKFRGVNRIDHHPRVNDNGTKVYIDVPHGANRKFGVVEL
ncbi:hypothetical protein QWY93_02050 [Echinicola jeungdonensis]|uniref:Uncharacterized protein n=1 Tax=Echinicola jeungdonensis TaxID=709343 RepID=A0ABV5J2T7_9BACT|nr:hypothetical protein [Echinicola jeungdonensis]MDN3668116.1 hypothetical protein [Echinicola jeungdonensis]